MIAVQHLDCKVIRSASDASRLSWMRCSSCPLSCGNTRLCNGSFDALPSEDLGASLLRTSPGHASETCARHERAICSPRCIHAIYEAVARPLAVHEYVTLQSSECGCLWRVMGLSTPHGTHPRRPIPRLTVRIQHQNLSCARLISRAHVHFWGARGLVRFDLARCQLEYSPCQTKRCVPDGNSPKSRARGLPLARRTWRW